MPKVRLLTLALASAAQNVGGQAVVEGVMMRDGDRLAIAVRKPDGDITVDTRPWRALTSWSPLSKPFVRGFPILVETMVNGISALNYSAKVAMEEVDGQELSPWALTLTMAGAIGFALLLFVVAPHLISIGMKAGGLSGGVESLSFHAWDGAFKLAIFLAYILAISFMPDVRRVFQYHGAEHKVIWTFENGQPLTPENARPFPRLHPRCGTAFMLIVLGLSIALYAVLVPALLTLYSPQTAWIKHVYIVAVKFVLMIPISAVAYECIKLAGKYHRHTIAKILSAPGLMMQMLTTFEPDDRQIEVAIAALKGAVAGREH